MRAISQHKTTAILWGLFLFLASDNTTGLAEVVVNELCYHADPSSDTGKEWIELYNSDTLERDISGWDLYPSRSPHFIFPALTKIGPKSHMVIFLRTDGINTATEIYEGTDSITSNMTNTKGSVALFTSSNRDTIVDFIQYGDDSMTYEAAAAAAGIWTRGAFLDTAICGNSLGLIWDGLDSNRKADWKEFVRPTPGQSNQPYPVDIAVTGITVTPDTLMPGRTIAIYAEISNLGLDTAYLPVINIFEDADQDSVIDPGEKRHGLISWDLLGDKRTALAQLYGPDEGQYNIAVSARCSSESYTANNYRSLLVTVGSPVVINEIMYYPYSGQAEWAELYNRSARPANIRGWTVEDANGEARMITYDGQTMLPNDYLILTSIDNQPLASCLRLPPLEGWPSLNDDGDLIRLRDLRGCQEDMVQYDNDWGYTRGQTLEKINPYLTSSAFSSWGGSRDPSGSTPGRLNSIYAENPSASAGLSPGPNPFSPDNDGHQDHTVINYKLPWNDAVVNLAIFDRTGRRVRNLLSNHRSLKDGCCAWDGRDEGRGKCPMGIYVILLEAREARGEATTRAKATVALAGKL